MATIAEILEQQGIQLNDEVKGKLSGLIEDSDEVKGLVKVKEDLLTQKAAARADSERKEAQISELTAKMQELQTKADQAKTAEEKLAAFEAKAQAESERAALLAEKNQQLNSKRANERKESLLDGIAGKFKNKLMAKGALSSLIDVSFDEDGNLTESFKDLKGNKLEVADLDSFFNTYVSKVDDFASEILTPHSSGANATGGSGSHSVTNQTERKPSKATQGYLANLTN